MSRKKTIDILDVDGCRIVDDDGQTLSILHQVGDKIVVKKTTSCSIGCYLFILTYLRELGFDVE